MDDVKVTMVPGGAEIRAAELRQSLEEHCKEMGERGWRLQTMTSRGGTIYCVFYRSVH